MHKSSIRIQSLLILLAFEDCSRRKNYYLNLDTGEVVEHDGSPEKYLKINKALFNGPKLMENHSLVGEFINRIENRPLREELFESFIHEQSTKRFEDILFDYPDLLNGWFEQKEKITLKNIKRWLDFHNINAELI